MRTFIYGLECPIEKVIRYIGKADDPEVRFVNHITTAKTGALDHHNARWIRKLLRQGLRPELKILAEVKDGERWQDIERRFIADAKKQGWRLTNVLAGGEGGCYIDPADRAAVSAKMSAGIRKAWADPKKRQRFLDGARAPDVVKRRSLAMTERNADPDFKAKQSTALKAACATPEWQAAQSERSRKSWANTGQRATRVAALVTAQNRPDVKAKVSRASVLTNARPEVKAARSVAMTKRNADPEYRAKTRTESARGKMSTKSKARWQNDRAGMLETMNAPARVAKLSESMVRRNADPAFRAKVSDPAVRARQAATLKATWARRKREAAQQQTEAA